MNLIWDEAGWNDWLLRDQWQCGQIKQLCSHQSSLIPDLSLLPFYHHLPKKVPDPIILAEAITARSDRFKAFHRCMKPQPAAFFSCYCTTAYMCSFFTVRSLKRYTFAAKRPHVQANLAFQARVWGSGSGWNQGSSIQVPSDQTGTHSFASTSPFLLGQLRGKEKEAHRRRFSTLLGTSGGRRFYGTMRTFFIAGSCRPIV